MTISGYSIYNEKYKSKIVQNTNETLFQPLPQEKFDVIYCDPPWDYGGKTQYDRTCIKDVNKDFEKDIFISSANLKYPTVKLKDLMKLDVPSIAEKDCILFMWTTGPQMENAILLGNAWGFQYKTLAFVWDKKVHNPGRYTLSQTEFILAFRKGRFPSPRGKMNARQLISIHRSKEHSEKPLEFQREITEMFPEQKKIELFARKKIKGWTAWGLEVPEKETDLFGNYTVDAFV